jgi:hypothetical protein
MDEPLWTWLEQFAQRGWSWKETIRLWYNVAVASGIPWQKASAPRYAPKLEDIKAAIQTDRYSVARNLTWTEWERLMGFSPGWTVAEGDSLAMPSSLTSANGLEKESRNRKIGTEEYGCGSILSKSYNVVNTDQFSEGDAARTVPASPVPSPSNTATAHLKDNSPSTSREPPDRASAHSTTKESASTSQAKATTT